MRKRDLEIQARSLLRTLPIKVYTHVLVFIYKRHFRLVYTPEAVPQRLNLFDQEKYVYVEIVLQIT